MECKHCGWTFPLKSLSRTDCTPEKDRDFEIVLKEDSDLVHMDPDYSSQLAYRKQLLCISDQLTARDIEKLLWLLKKVIPLAKAEKISKGYQLFDELEKQRLLGLNNLDTICKCLSVIGRQDLIKLLTMVAVKPSRAMATHAPISCSTVTPMSTLPQSVEDFGYRKQLLHISDHLSSEDVEALLWLLKSVIPQAKAEKITEGYQLFDELEKRGYSGPSSLSFLRMHLLVANREDLACKLETATHTPIPHTPSTIITTHYTQVFRMKTTECMTKINSLAHIGSSQAGEEWEKLKLMIYNVVHEIGYASELDIPVEWWQPTATQAQIDEIVRSTLQNAYAYAKAQFSCCYDLLPRHMDEIWQSCYKHYQMFDQELDTIQWNTPIRTKIDTVVNTRLHPHGQLANHICEYAHSICADLLHDRHFQTEINRVNNSLFVLESMWYMRWQTAGWFHWISNLLHLAQSSIIDLSRHRELLIKILVEHKENIHLCLDKLSNIVGEGGMQKLSPALKHLEGQPGSSLTQSHESELLCMPILWYIPLMELVALAEGHYINPHEIGRGAIQQMLLKESYHIIQNNVRVIQSAANRMHTEIAKLWQHATKVAYSSDYNVPVQELFPHFTS